MTPHNEANINDIANIVLMPGDPRRAKLIADNFLENAKLVNEVRNIYAYTGTYKNKQITVMASGMGMPSMAIYSYELFKYYNVEKIIRLGSCMTLSKDIKLNDLILATASYTLSNFAYSYDEENIHDVDSSKKLNNNVIEASKELGIHITPGKVTSSDAFYHEYIDKEEEKTIGLEMETFALFYLAKKLNKDATAILTASDSKFSDRKLTPDEREKLFINAIKLGLESIIK